MAETVEIKRRRALSGWPMIIGWLAMLVFAFHACTHMVGAGDTWVAMACGRHFINHGVDTVEPFSANAHKAGPTEAEIKKWPGWAQWLTNKVGPDNLRYSPTWVNRLSSKLPRWLYWPSGWHPTGWVNQNWLTHVIFYWLTHLSPFADADTNSFNMLVYWKFAIYVLMVICVYYTGRVLGVNPALSAVFACFAMFVGRSFFDIRPAGFSNMLVAVFLLILVLATYKNILYIWLIVPITVFWCNVHGGYIYVFIMLAPFVALNFAAIPFQKRFVSIGLKGIYHTAGAGFTALICAILFNPFHLTNFTHTLLISFSRHAEMWRNVNEWHPAFEWSNPVGDEIPFLIMYIIGWVAVFFWGVVLIWTYRFVKKRSVKRRAKTTDEHQWPRIDAALFAIASLTIYMAIRSRRFIPIAAIAACPIIAMLINQMICAISSTRNFHKEGRLFISPMPQILRQIFILSGVFAVLFFGIWWGLKFKRVYLDPWPMDSQLNSVFIRMTASDAKPFYACKFIRDNKLQGKMFNYWTEGGFIAWGQEPDPNTGQTPLQLFMDGRAQAAYEPAVYKLWSNIMAGGPIVLSANLRKQKITAADHMEISKWIGRELRKQDVWAVLMPLSKNARVFVISFERNPEWPVIFLNDRQKLFVDIRTQRGKELFEGMKRGKTIYPDEFSRNLILAHNLFVYGATQEARKQGLEFAIKAFEISPSPVSSQRILFSATRFPYLANRVRQFCVDYLQSFNKKKKLWAKQDGYHHKVVTAINVMEYLRGIAQKQKDTKLADSFTEKIRELSSERKLLVNTKRW
jgi:hypothetical protein